MSYPAFDKLEKSALHALPVRQNTNGKGKTVMLECDTSRQLKFSTPKNMRQKWAIVPATMEAEIKDTDKMNIEVELDSATMGDFLNKCNQFDSFVMESGFAHRKDWFGDKNASRMDSIDALKLTYTKLTSEGKMSKTGSKYPDSVRFKIEGWAPYLDSVVYREDGPTKGMAKECVWKSRVVDDMNPLGIKDGETKFYLFEKKDPVTGVDDYIYKLPVVDSAMNQMRNANGNGVFRYVGPQDCKPNSQLQVVFSASRVWISDVRFGVSLIAKEVWIKSPPPPTVQKLDGVRVNAKVDVAAAIRLISTMQSAEANYDEDLEDQKADDAELTIKIEPKSDHKIEPKAEKHERSAEPKAEEAAVEQNSPTKKRKTTKDTSKDTAAKPIILADPL